MTRKDYIKIAKVFNKYLGSEEYNDRNSDSMFWILAYEMEDMLAKDNERFDSTKFISAIKGIN